MSKSRAAAPKRRGRQQIDRNYFFGDVFIKTGVAVAVALGFIALATPMTLTDYILDGAYDYLALMGIFATVGMASFLYGRFLRRQATHWDFD